MIKGVGRYAVEVSDVESEFFERVICFVRPQYAGDNSLDLHREAVRVADDLSAEVEEAQHGRHHVLRTNSHKPGGRSRTPRQTQPYAGDAAPKRPGVLLPMLLSAGGGAAAALLITTFL